MTRHLRRFAYGTPFVAAVVFGGWVVSRDDDVLRGFLMLVIGASLLLLAYLVGQLFEETRR